MTTQIRESESDILNAICEYLFDRKHHFGWRQNTVPVFNKATGKFRSMPRYSMNGVPDIIVVKNGIFWGLEVKTRTGEQSEAQKIFESKCKRSGGQYYIVSSINDVISLGF